jgi:predicted amidohydrolase
MRVAIVQMLVEMGEKEANQERALVGIAEAAEQKADLVVLPECCDVGWLCRRARALAEPVPGALTRRFGQAARAHGVYLCLGFTEQAGECVHNAALLYDRQGRLVLRHRKINELEVGLRTYARGTELRVAETEFGTVGVNICADNWVPFIDETLACMGARFVVSPCAWACEPRKEASNSKAIREKFRKRTVESQLFLVGANSVGELTEGPWKGRILHGRSLVYGPGGRELLAGDLNKEQVLYCEIA